MFDPLVKKGVSNIEATIPSDTQFQLLQEIDYGYESDDDDDYLPDSLKEAETFGNYTPEDLVMSSAIEGFQPMKYSVISNAESDDYDKTYGKKQGAIRRRLKNKIMGQAIVGTKKGQWSARKSQELKRQYEEACEKKGLKAYKGKKTEKQKDLSKWSKQDWTTKSGKPSSKTGERYLPAKAIKALTDKEYKKTSDKKRKDSKKGKQFSDQPKSIANKVAKYRAESSKKPHSVTISRSSNSEKKLMAVFEDSEGKKIKTTHFGQRGASDYTKHGEKERMERYLERHGGGTTTSTKEDWKDPTTAGALSRWILWNKPSLKASFDDYKSRFGLKGSINVSKSAEDVKDAQYQIGPTAIYDLHEKFEPYGRVETTFGNYDTKVMMTPKQFISICYQPLREDSNQEKLIKYRESLEKCIPLHTPVLQVKKHEHGWEVIGHEGRHRVQSLIDMGYGDVKIPVSMWPSGYMGDPYSTKGNNDQVNEAFKDVMIFPESEGEGNDLVFVYGEDVESSYKTGKIVNLATEERKCKSCGKPATNVVQEGSFCFSCLPINLGA